MGRKKKTETLLKEREKAEKELETIENILKEKKQEIEFDKATEELQNIIREDLMDQLHEQEKFGKYFEDLVEDYVYNVGLKRKLQNDIDINGIRYKATTGNGYTTFKPNESIVNLHKTNAQMLKILSDLNLKEPDANPDNGAGDGGDDLGDGLL